MGEFEILLYTTIALIIFFVGFNLFAIIKLILNKSVEEKKIEKPLIDMKKGIIPLSEILKYLGYRIRPYRVQIIDGVVLILIIICLHLIFYPSVYIESTYPVQGGEWDNPERPIEIIFNRPVRENVLEVHTSENLDGRWEFEKPIPFLPLSRKLKFIPHKTYEPGIELKLYLVNFNPRDIGEFPLSFTYTKFPLITKFSPDDRSESVAVEDRLEFTFDKPIPKIAELEFEFIPTFEYDKKIDNQKITIIPKSSLSQTTKYTASIYEIPQIYDLSKNQLLEQKEKIKIFESSFTTIKEPLIKSSSPSGTGVLTDTIIEVVFDEEMVKEDVEKNFSITPEVKGAFVWIDDKTFQFKPEPGALAKNTLYTIKFTKGIRGVKGGVIEKEVGFDFTTIGPIKVSGVAPANGASNVDNASSITITFDQEVDQASAQNAISLSPAVNGRFIWNGKSVTFDPTANLTPSTKYTITVNKGIKSINGLDAAETFTYSFTTRSEVVLLSVPYRAQGNDFTCNCTSLSMLLAFRGQAVDRYTICNAVRNGQASRCSGAGCTGGGDPFTGWVDNYGVYWNPLANYATSRGLTSQLHVDWNLTAALREVQAGNPVMIWYQNGSSAPTDTSYTTTSGKFIKAVNGMHSVVIIGFIGTPENPSTIYYHDPYFGATRSRSAASFDFIWSTWRLNGGVPANYRRVGLVVK